jgi:hypothetical protein
MLKINIKYYFNIFLNIKYSKLRNNVSLTIKGVKERKRIIFLSKRYGKNTERRFSERERNQWS